MGAPEGTQVVICNAEECATPRATWVKAWIKMGGFETNWHILVAPIKKEVLLWLDLLQEADVQLQAQGSAYTVCQRVKS